ncbi:MAG TPA: HIT family protein [Gemmata sp.]|jgi:diadenosine tetraphosphate (Ap4A) HIT family hydrolase|nr:HIT family protein [Gemmata sp.]
MSHELNCPFCKAISNPQAAWGENLIWRFPHSFAVLGPWQHFTGYCMLISREHASELSQLGANRTAFLEEMAWLAEAIENCFHPHKLNYELLGNQVPHLHWHLFPRSADDPDRLRPVWFALERADSDNNEKMRLRTGKVFPSEAVTHIRNWLKNAPGVPGSI